MDERPEPERCFEKMCGSPNSEDGKAERQQAGSGLWGCLRASPTPVHAAVRPTRAAVNTAAAFSRKQTKENGNSKKPPALNEQNFPTQSAARD